MLLRESIELNIREYMGLGKVRISGEILLG